jgi:predicted TIM-barrel fold metal-dependent hydrolase
MSSTINTPITSRKRGTQQITTHTDSREILANARRDIGFHGMEDYYIVDVDSHHVEFDSWNEVLDHIEDPVIRRNGKTMSALWPNAKNIALHHHPAGITYQDVHGRIPHQIQLAEDVDTSNGEHRDLTLFRRAIDSMGIDVQVVFPQPMLEIGLHPNSDMENHLTFAYNRWFTSRILGKDPRIKSMLALPFNSPEACLRMIREFGETKGVVGFLVSGQRTNGVHRNEYMPVYRELEERGLPLAFHAGPDYSVARLVNRFLSVHSLSFVTCCMIHLTNWVINGLPERFPKLNVIWIESGLAWLPFMMQRLDHEYLMRQSDAPLLKKLPSEYMREMYYTSQPMERTNLKLLESTFEAINAESQLLYASDWPHWDFDTPGSVASLPFLSEQGKRNILGENARRLFKL